MVRFNTVFLPTSLTQHKEPAKRHAPPTLEPGMVGRCKVFSAMPPLIFRFIAMALMLAFGATGASLGSTSRPVQLESVKLDVDGDGRPDTITVWGEATPTDPGQVSRVQIRTATGRTMSLSGSWDELTPEDIGQLEGNLAKSKYLYVNLYKGAGLLIFLQGENVSCCLRSLDVIRIDDGQIQRYLHEESFRVIGSITPKARGRTKLTGIRNLSEITGSPVTGYADATSYQPTVVYNLDRHAKIDLIESRRLTEQSQGGFAGLVPSSTRLVLRQSNGSRVLWFEPKHHE